MFQIAYRSVLHAGVGEAEISSIAERSAEKNQAAGITGVWLLAGRRCLGALEGDPRVLRSHIEAIWDDPRHDGFDILNMRTRMDPAFEWPFLLVRAETLNEAPELAGHPGLTWLAQFEGGLAAFFAGEHGAGGQQY